MSHSRFSTTVVRHLLGWVGIAILAVSPLWPPLFGQDGATPAPPAEAEVVSSKIVDATLYSDQARVAREIEANAAAGLHRVRITPLPIGLLPNSIQVDADPHLRVLGARLIAESGEEQASPEYLAVEKERKAKVEELQALRRRAQVAQRRYQAFQRLGVQPPEREGTWSPLEINPGSWRAFIDLVRSGMEESRAAHAPLQLEMEETQRAIGRLDARLAELAPPDRDTRREVEITYQNTTGAAGSLRLVYRLGRALWYPAYTLNVRPDEKQLELTMYAVVHQQTGEAWPEIPLRFSTSVPESGAGLPELYAQTIGRARYDKRSFDSSSFARFSKRPPAPKNKSTERWADDEDAEADSVGQIDIDGSLAVKPSRKVAYDRRAAANAEERLMLDEVRRERPRARRGRTRGYVSERPRAAAQPQMGLAGGAARANPDFPAASADFKAGAFAYDEEPEIYLQHLRHAVLPIVGARGFVHTFESQRNEAVPSDGEPHRLLVGKITLPYEEARTVVPEHSLQVFRRLIATLGGRAPLLTGPASIFFGRSYLGIAPLETTAPGEELTVHLGVDDRMRVKRETRDKEEDIGVFSRARRYSTTVEIKVENYRDEAVEVVVHERVPFTESEDLEVALDSDTTPRPTNFNEANGLARWKLTVPKNGKKEIELRYQIDAPRNAQLTRQEVPARLDEGGAQ